MLVLAGLVAVASPGTSAWTPLREGRVDRSEMLANVAIFVGVGAIAALAVTLLIHRTLIAGRDGAPPLRTTLLRALPIATVAVVVLSLLAIARTDLGRETEGSDESLRAIEPSDRRGELWGFTDSRDSPVRAGEGDSKPNRPGGAEPEPGARLPNLLIVLGVVAAAIVGAFAWRWYARRSAPPEPPRDDDAAPADSDHESAHEAVIATIDAMLADPDPNTAIIGAYARLLEGLAACAVGRRDHEAPMEHLQRALATLDVRPEPLRRLIDLFEIARFSTHALTESHRDQALDALRAAAADLAADSGSPAAAAGSQPIGAPR